VAVPKNIRRAFHVGDGVVAMSSVVVPPVSTSSPRLEIPRGSVGVVDSVRSYGHAKPYTVSFIISDTVMIEADVAEHQLARIEPSGEVVDNLADLVPDHVDMSKDMILQAMYDPTVERPHYQCWWLHLVQIAALLGLYIEALIRTPFVSAIFGMVVILGMYSNQLAVEHEWAWIPHALRPVELAEGQRLSTDDEFVRRSFISDRAYALVLVVTFLAHFGNIVNLYNPGWVPYVVLAVMCFIAWMGKSLTHQRATTIRYEYGD
jgi:hypothetical protein